MPELERMELELKTKTSTFNPISLFDVDGTLLKGFSIIAFARFLNSNRNFSLTAWNFMQEDLGRYNGSQKDDIAYRIFAENLVKHYALGLQGQKVNIIYSLSHNFHREALKGKVPEYTLLGYSYNLVHLLKAKMKTVAISGSPLESLWPLKKYMGFDEMWATKLTQQKGMFTGGVDINMAVSEGKRSVVQSYSDIGFDYQKSFVFGDTASDLPILKAVGNPFVVGENEELKRIGKERGWSVASYEDDISRIVMARLLLLFGDKS